MRRQSSVGHFFVSEYPRTVTPACFFALTIIASYALAFGVPRRGMRPLAGIQHSNVGAALTPLFGHARQRAALAVRPRVQRSICRNWNVADVPTQRLDTCGCEVSVAAGPPSQVRQTFRLPECQRRTV